MDSIESQIRLHADGFREGFGKLTKSNGDVFVGQYESGELIKKTRLDKHSLEMGVDEEGKKVDGANASAPTGSPSGGVKALPPPWLTRQAALALANVRRARCGHGPRTPLAARDRRAARRLVLVHF